MADSPGPQQNGVLDVPHQRAAPGEHLVRGTLGPDGGPGFITRENGTPCLAVAGHVRFQSAPGFITRENRVAGSTSSISGMFQSAPGFITRENYGIPYYTADQWRFQSAPGFITRENDGGAALTVGIDSVSIRSRVHHPGERAVDLVGEERIQGVSIRSRVHHPGELGLKR